MARKCVACVMEESWRFYCSGANDDIGDAVIEITLDRFQIAYAATQLSWNFITNGFNNLLDGGFVLRLARKGAIKIHEMQSPRPLVQPMPGHCPGVFREHRRIFHYALFETDAM